MKPEQLAMFDLPPIPPADPVAKKSRAPKPGVKRARQKSLGVKLYNVQSASFEWEVQAASPSAAKYMAYQMARAAGHYLYSGGFLAFVAGDVRVRELRR